MALGDPIPYVVEASGEAPAAPAGAIPIALYGGETGDKTEINALTTLSNAGTLADLTAAQTAINTVIAKVNAIINALKA